MYGPVPEEKETEDPVIGYEYVLGKEDTEQIAIVRNRILDYLYEYGEQYNDILAYAVSKPYRSVIQKSFDAYGEGTVFPRDPDALRLTEHFRQDNIRELLEYLGLPTESLDIGS
jgi:hypothetical protein